MEYNKKGQLLDKIGGLELVNPDGYGAKYNKGVRDAKARVVSFFNKELVPEVPQHVADWYEDNKNNLDKNIYDCIVGWGIHSSDEREWMRENIPFQTLVNMHQFGYKVKEDKKYTVKMVGLSNNLSYLNYDSIDDEWYFNDADNGHAVGTYHTKKKLEDAGFSNVFDNPMFEVKEVE